MPFTETQRQKVQELLEPLQERFPALQQNLPLALDTKQRLAEIASEFQVAKHLIVKAVGVLTQRAAYQKALAAPNSMRHTLEGVPVEPVSEDHRAFAQQKIDAYRERNASPARRPSAKAAKAQKAQKAQTATELSADLLLEIVTMAIPGKLDVTLKINELPTVKPTSAQTVAFAVRADQRTVLVELKNKAWNNLKNTADGYPQWVASITGKIGAEIEGGFRLENPAVQIFEKKAKAASAEASAPTPTSTPVPTPAPTPALPSINTQKPLIKLRKPTP